MITASITILLRWLVGQVQSKHDFKLDECFTSI
jgi:hypothetical protein